MIFSHFQFLQENVRGGKGGTFMVGPGRHLTLLRHWPYQNDNYPCSSKMF